MMNQSYFPDFMPERFMTLAITFYSVKLDSFRTVHSSVTDMFHDHCSSLLDATNYMENNNSENDLWLLLPLKCLSVWLAIKNYKLKVCRLVYHWFYNQQYRVNLLEMGHVYVQVSLLSPCSVIVNIPKNLLIEILYERFIRMFVTHRTYWFMKTPFNKYQ
jgi:hypothetical protein